MTILKCPICDYQAEHSLVTHIVQHSLTVTQFIKQHPNVPIVSEQVTNILKKFDLQKQPTSTQTGEAFPFQEFNFQDQDKYLIPEVDDCFIFPRETYFLYPAIKDNLNVYIAGPSGCGKSTLILQTAAKLNKAIIRMNLHGHNTVADFIGKMEYEEGKGTFFNYGVLPKAMKNGYWLLLDEVDFASPSVLHALQSALEVSRRVFLPQTNESIVAHPNFRVFCTANTTGKGDTSGLYTGVDILNSAFLRRFQIKFKLDYPTKEQEKNIILKKYPSISITLLNNVLLFAERIRTGINKGEFQVTFSTAELLAWIHNCNYFSVLDAADITFMSFWTEEEQNAAKTLIKTIGF